MRNQDLNFKWCLPCEIKSLVARVNPENSTNHYVEAVLQVKVDSVILSDFIIGGWDVFVSGDGNKVWLPVFHDKDSRSTKEKAYIILPPCNNGPRFLIDRKKVKKLYLTNVTQLQNVVGSAPLRKLTIINLPDLIRQWFVQWERLHKEWQKKQKQVKGA